jgi:hypothetical protein
MCNRKQYGIRVGVNKIEVRNLDRLLPQIKRMIVIEE